MIDCIQLPDIEAWHRDFERYIIVKLYECRQYNAVVRFTEPPNLQTEFVDGRIVYYIEIEEEKR